VSDLSGVDPSDVDLADIDLTDYALYRRGFPHPVFTHLRRHAPVWKHPDTDVLRAAGVPPFWVLSRHGDLRDVNRDTTTFTAFDGAQIRDTSDDRKGKMLISMDGKPHSRLRRLVSRGFTPRMLDSLEGHLQWRTNQILDSIDAGAEIDFVRDVAELLPLHVIADIIGIPEAERPDVFEGTNTILRAFDPEGGVGLDKRLETERRLFAYATAFNDAKRRTPGDDIWSALVQAEVVDDDGTPTRLSNHELDLFFFLLAAAGSETTRNAISHGMLALIENPTELARLRSNPDLMDSAVNEILRWSSPVSYFRRTATRDVELRGQQIRAGDRVTFWHPSANRDDDVFDDPFTFDLSRSPNDQVAFGGGGPHHCLGAALARREIRIMLEGLVGRFDTWVVTGEPTWAVPGPLVTVVCSLDRLPIRLGRTA
jgi:cholest-4-en-3-one 26-monooxygenase